MMKQSKKKIILNNRQELLSQDFVERPKREGIELEKGSIITEEYMVRHEENLRKWITFFSVYPDYFLDMISPTDSNFKLFFYQRIVLRAFMRFKDIYITAPRAFSKSFLTILAFLLQCIFIPGRKIFICANTKQQAAQITKEKIYEIYDHWPLLKKEVMGSELKEYPGNFGRDYVSLTFRNGSKLDVVLAGDAARGGRRHGGLIDEIRDADEDAINNVVLPLVNVSRRLPDNTVNPKEPNQQVVCATSAGNKLSFSYDKLIDMLENAIINPKSAMVIGCDYRIPAMHGLVDLNYINKLKMSPSYDPKSFAKEYMSIWEGASDESWYNFDKLQKYRKIKNPEMRAFYRANSNYFYLLAVDVGRLGDQTAVSVFRVNITKERYLCTLVNLVVLGRTSETKQFSIQARDLKKLIRDYKPKEVVIDTNGLGIGLADEMIKEQLDEKGEVLPAYGFKNDENYLKIQPKEAPQILYGIKANGPLNSKIHGNCYSKVNSGAVRFLIKEQEAKTALLSTKVGQKMTVEERVKRLLPHEMTSRLFEELANLRLKRTGVNLDIVLERINSRYPKDKYTSFAYGLWRIKEIEEESFKRKRRRGDINRQLIFFTGGQ